MADTPTVVARRLVMALATALSASAILPASVSACSPLFEKPTIKALGPSQLVVVGRVGEPVPGGRLFHVERWFNGGEPGTPIVIAFKEGEALGDCSYPVLLGERKIIAPARMPDGTLYADLVTLQADPDSDDGRRYLAEADALFGPGVVPEPVAPSGPADPDLPLLPIGALVTLGIGIILVVMRRRGSETATRPAGR